MAKFDKIAVLKKNGDTWITTTTDADATPILAVDMGEDHTLRDYSNNNAYIGYKNKWRFYS